MKIVVLGGGLAGLAVATHLADEGHGVTVIERGPRLGGRHVHHMDDLTGESLDAGPPAFLGKRSRALIARLGVGHTLRGLDRLAFVDLEHPRRRPFSLRLPSSSVRAPAPVAGPAAGSVTGAPSITVTNAAGVASPVADARLRDDIKGTVDLLAGFAGFEALAWLERAQLVRATAAALAPRAALQVPERETADGWLTRHGQSHNARRSLWHPLARSLVRDDPERASARVFITALREAITAGRTGEEVVVRADFHAAAIAAAAAQLVAAPGLAGDATSRATVAAGGAGGAIRTSTVVARLLIEQRDGGAIARGVALDTGEELHADLVVSALDPLLLLPLLPATIADDPFFRGAALLPRATQTIVHLFFDDPVGDGDCRALLGSRFHWLAASDHVTPGGRTHGRVTLGALADEALAALADQAIVDQAAAIARGQIPHATTVARSRVVREQTLACRPESEPLRPNARSPIEGLFLAADWIRTGFPPTIEGISRAAEDAAAQALAYSPPPRRIVPASSLVRAAAAPSGSIEGD